MAWPAARTADPPLATNIYCYFVITFTGIYYYFVSVFLFFLFLSFYGILCTFFCTF